jgi:uncharacterized damage-inducible protein DinB
MTTPQLLRQYTRYNLWANQAMFGWLGTHTDLWEQHITSSFPSIRATFLHIWDAEAGWLARFEHQDMTRWPSEVYTGPNEQLQTDLLASSQRVVDFFAACSDDFFDVEMGYRQKNGTAYSNQVSDMLLHCMQHSTYHRGQLVTMGRQLGLTDPPKTDYIHYVRTL